MGEGALTVVGTGIRAVSQATTEAVAFIKAAEKLLYLTAEPISEAWLLRLNPEAESLGDSYQPGRPRLDTYAEITERILAPVRAGHRVCAAFYGHPGVLVRPSHEAVARARAEGFEAVMLPAVSAEDCLYADLGVDPGMRGCQIFDATDFLIFRRQFDPTSSLILWQIPAVGILTTTDLSGDETRRGLRVLCEYLLRHYPGDHQVVVYEASPYPIHGPSIERLPLEALGDSSVTILSTLFVPPLPQRAPDPEILTRLGVTASELKG